VDDTIRIGNAPKVRAAMAELARTV